MLLLNLKGGEKREGGREGERERERERERGRICSDDSHSRAELEKNMSLKYTPFAQSILSSIFFFQTRVATTCRLNYNGQESKTTFAVYHCDVHVTLKQGPSHEIWYEFLAKQGYIIT